MILLCANLLCVGGDPLALACSTTAEEAGALLRRTQDPALVDDARWGAATLVGTGFRMDGDNPRGLGLHHILYLRAGITWSVAPAAGLGFSHEAGTMGDEYREVLRARASERRLVEAISEYCQGIHGLPVAAEVDAIGEWREDFAISYRRRIAYALGFHASLRAGSRACFEVRDAPLILGTAAELDVAARGSDAFEAFSLRLNLLARLRRAIAHERRHGAPHRAVAGAVHARREKEDLLEGRLAEASEQVARRLHADGQLALRTLLRHLRAERDEGAWQVDIAPVWGSGPGYAARSER